MRVGFDVDGLLADFNVGFINALNQEVGTQVVCSNYLPKVWDYAPLFYTDDVIRATWEHIKSPHTQFWARLPVCWFAERCAAALWSLYGEHDVYFITARPGASAKAQTESWLREHFKLSNPTVLISSQKGLAAAVLGLDVYVDDNLDNITAVQNQSPRTQALLYDYAYNRVPADMPDVKHRIDRLDDVFTYIKARAHTAPQTPSR